MEIGLAIVSLVFNVIQWIQQYVGFQDRTLSKRELDGIKTSLIQLNAMCNDAEQKGDNLKPDAMARFISDVAHWGRAIEHHVDLARGALKVIPETPQPWYRRWLGYIFPLSRRL